MKTYLENGLHEAVGHGVPAALAPFPRVDGVLELVGPVVELDLGLEVAPALAGPEARLGRFRRGMENGGDGHAGQRARGDGEAELPEDGDVEVVVEGHVEAVRGAVKHRGSVSLFLCSHSSIF